MEKNNTEIKVTEMETTEVSAKEKKKPVKMPVIVGTVVMLVLLTVLGILYGRNAAYYRTHFFPNTKVNGEDCSKFEAVQVISMIDDRIQEYTLEVVGRINADGEIGSLGTIGTKDIGLQYTDTVSAVEDLLKEQNKKSWISTLGGNHYSYHVSQGVIFDEDALTDLLSGWDAFSDMKEPQDAYISEYSEEEGGYTIIPETLGTSFDTEQAVELIKNAIIAQEKSINLEELGLYESAEVTVKNAGLNQKVDTINKWLQTCVTYDWNGQEVIVDRELLQDWVSFEDGEPKLDEEAVADFVAKKAQERDTYGKSRNFITALGVELNLPGFTYGWKTDREAETKALIDLISQGSVVKKEPAYTRKGTQKGMNDIGSSYVEADLTNQHLYVYQDGVIVLETDFVSGDPNMSGCMTPFGIFGLTYKTTNAVLRGADYETPVFYWMPFYGNFGMHDATWRTEFGGDIYLTNGSHGCLNLPLDKAAAIYGYVYTGSPIICYYY